MNTRISEVIVNSCWLLGLIYLPLNTNEIGYNRNRILNMILIHDLSESFTGDIPSPIKDKDPSYDEKEDLIMRQLFLKGTYNSIPNLFEQYELWVE